MARRLTWAGACLILLNSAYLASFSDPTLVFVVNVLFHVGGGALFLGLLVWRLWGDPRRGLFTLLLLAGGLGLILALYGATRPNQGILWAHIALGVAGMILLIWDIRRTDYAVLLVACLFFPLAIAGYRARHPDPWARIRNSPPPSNMEGEGDGPNGLFFPSSASTRSGGRIP